MDGEVIFIDGPIELELDGPIVRARVRSGQRTLIFVATVNDFLESFARGAQIAHQWTVDTATDTVVPIRGPGHSSRRPR
jgi:hypothetical protein